MIIEVPTRWSGLPFIENLFLNKYVLMAYPQLVRLKQDYKELQHYLCRLQKDGRLSRAELIKAKLIFLADKINSYEDTIDYSELKII